jgi:hypothetical protein
VAPEGRPSGKKAVGLRNSANRAGTLPDAASSDKETNVT